MTQSQTTFLNSNGILTPSQKRQQNLDRFYDWMRMVNNVHLADVRQMDAAYQKID
jgi:hypothetical protein